MGNYRVSNYPNINIDFQPYDLFMCALLDSYVPNQINYYSLNPNDFQNNSKLAISVMNDFGIPIFLYPDEISEKGNKIDEKVLLTQLSSAKLVLDSIQKNKQKKLTQKVEKEKKFRNKFIIRR